MRAAAPRRLRQQLSLVSLGAFCAAGDPSPLSLVASRRFGFVPGCYKKQGARETRGSESSLFRSRLSPRTRAATLLEFASSGRFACQHCLSTSGPDSKFHPRARQSRPTAPLAMANARRRPSSCACRSAGGPVPLAALAGAPRRSMLRLAARGHISAHCARPRSPFDKEPSPLSVYPPTDHICIFHLPGCPSL